MSERVVENLNKGLSRILETHPKAVLLGEDVLDPYGGAFQVTRGLSSKFPEQVLSMPISEQAIVALANGMALAGDQPIVEIMFGDFLSLAFDQILNIGSKIPEMTGIRTQHQVVIRAPYGAHRGYGSTHSQSLQKHFIGIPNVAVYEMSPFHDNFEVFSTMLGNETLAVHFENKILYTRRCIGIDKPYDIFQLTQLQNENDFVALKTTNKEFTDLVIICAGGLVYDAMTVAKEQLIENERETTIVVPSKLYPLDVDPVISMCEKTQQIVIIEEGVSGGSWGETVAQSLYSKIWGKINSQILLISSRDFSIPSARHLEEEVVINPVRIQQLINKAIN